MLCVKTSGETKVGKLDMTSTVQQDVVWFDVAV